MPSGSNETVSELLDYLVQTRMVLKDQEKKLKKDLYGVNEEIRKEVAQLNDGNEPEAGHELSVGPWKVIFSKNSRTSLSEQKLLENGVDPDTIAESKVTTTGKPKLEVKVGELK
jgi:hypothetical protein